MFLGKYCNYLNSTTNILPSLKLKNQISAMKPLFKEEDSHSLNPSKQTQLKPKTDESHQISNEPRDVKTKLGC